jgi:tellurite resistance protein TehA-like permease
MKRTRRGRAWKVFEHLSLAVCILVLVVNAREVIREFTLSSLDMALWFTGFVVLSLPVAPLEHLLRYRGWVRKEYRYQRPGFVVHWRLYRRWRQLGAPDPDEV